MGILGVNQNNSKTHSNEFPHRALNRLGDEHDFGNVIFNPG